MFHLKPRIEQRGFPSYELQVAKSGVKLKESSVSPDASTPPAGDDGFPQPRGNRGIASRRSVVEGYELNRVRAIRATPADLSGMLQNQNEPPILDKTGLTGKYDFTLEYTRELPGVRPDAASQPRVAFDVLLIESVDRKPAEN